MPDGSLVMMQNPQAYNPWTMQSYQDMAPAQPQAPGTWDRFRSAVSRFLRPAQAQNKWWIQQPQPVAARPAQAQAPALPPYNDWDQIQAEAENRAKIVEQLGEFPQRMMESPLVEGRLTNR